MAPNEIIKNIFNNIVALDNDGKLYFSGEKTFSTSARKSMIIDTITTIKSNLEDLEKTLNSTDTTANTN